MAWGYPNQLALAVKCESGGQDTTCSRMSGVPHTAAVLKMYV